MTSVTRDSIIEAIALPPEVIDLIDGFCSITGKTRPEFIQDYLATLPAETDPQYADLMSLVNVLVEAKTAKWRDELHAVCEEVNFRWNADDAHFPIWND